MARELVWVLGLPFDAVSLAEAVDRIRAAAFANTRCFVSTPNLNFVVQARSDASFRRSVLQSDLSLADGAPIVWTSRLLGLPLRERVAGASVFEALRVHPGPPIDVFFFGGPPGVAAAACRVLNAGSSGLRCVGFDEAGFGSIEEMSAPARLARINESGAQFVVVALGAVKGQAWLVRNQAALRAPVLAHLGAVVNFVAGTVRRAPLWAQRLGLEWAWRIKEQPPLWRRYAKDAAAFAVLCGPKIVRLVAARLSATRGRQHCRVTVEAAASETRIHVAGLLTAATIGPLRQALAEASAKPRPISLALEDVTAIDGAGIGLLLLGVQALGPERFCIRRVPPAILKALQDHDADDLLEASG